MKIQSVTAVATLIAFSVAPVAQAGDGLTHPAIEYITNGGFETGTTGWDKSETGNCNWALNTGAFNPPGPGEPLSVIAGGFDQVSNQGGPGQCRLSQVIIAPIDVGEATLTWADRVRNYAGEGFEDHNQEWRALARTNSGTFISEIYSTDPGDPTIQTGPNDRSFDVTALLAGREGLQTRLSWEEQDNLNYFNATLDQVSLKIRLLDEDNDGVSDSFDFCPGTVIPEALVPTNGEVLVNHFALFNSDTVFDTTAPYGGGGGSRRSYTIADTGGCSCEQIIVEQGLGQGHQKNGCAIEAMDDWVAFVQQ